MVCIIGAIYACPCRRTSRKDEVATEFNGLWKARVFLQLVGALWAVSTSCWAIADVTAAVPNLHVSGLAGHSMLATCTGCMHCCRAIPPQLFAAQKPGLCRPRPHRQAAWLPLQLAQILRLDALWVPEGVIFRSKPDVTGWTRNGVLCRIYLTLSLGILHPLFLCTALLLCRSSLRYCRP